MAGRVIHVPSHYCRPQTENDVHTDIEYEPAAFASQAFLKGPKGRKRPRDGQNDGSFYHAPEVSLIRQFFKAWRRPLPRKTSSHRSKRYEIFVVDVIDGLLPYEQAPSSVQSNLSFEQPQPVVQIFGNELDDGTSIALRIWGFYPYIVCECPVSLLDATSREDDRKRVAETFRQHLESNLPGGAGAGFRRKVISVQILEGESLMDYDTSKTKTFFKVLVADPRLVSSVRTLIESGIKLNGSHQIASTVYEVSVPFNLRWMIDNEVVGCGCIAVEIGDCVPVPDKFRQTRAQVECDTYWTSVTALPNEGKYSRLPDDLRVLALDIECTTVESEGFPVPEKDPVIQISSVLVTPGRRPLKFRDAIPDIPLEPPPEASSPKEEAWKGPKKPAIKASWLAAKLGHSDLTGGLDETESPQPQKKLVDEPQESGEVEIRMIFTLDTCAAVGDAIVFSFEDERAMLYMWREMVVHLDPDILTGYNFINFDLYYLVTRSIALDIPNFRNLGRVTPMEAKVRDVTLSTKALGTSENKDVNIEGRIQLDCYEMIRREYKLKSYSLNNVSAHFLHETKEDVHYSQIGDLQRGNKETRRRIAVYCLKDSVLVIRVIHKLCFIVNYIEMARVTGVPLNLLLTRGQQIKVTSQLLRKCRELKHFMPSYRTQGGPGEVQYEGATVLEPMKAFYEAPIATLDFASLYPSIMIAHNLCYSTLVQDGNSLSRMKLTEDDVFRTPAGKVFVRQHIKEGILPIVVSCLLKERKKAKREMADAEDEFMKMVLDGRQLALKISANSVYGYTGAASNGQLPCLAVSESITAYGRTMIEFTKNQVESHYTKQNGYADDAQVIYGDTDSVMVRFGESVSMEEAMRLGKEASVLISKKFINPISLEFEKIFFPFLLMNKKRYAGLKWTRLDKHDKIDCKGIETVRRDFCLLVQQVIDEALKFLLIDRDVEAARQNTKNKIRDLLMNKIDMSMLVLSKSLGKEEYATKLAHVELAKKLKQRDPAHAPQIGQRVFYVVIAGPKGQPQYEKAEDPIYALENNIPIDTDFYLDSLKNPVLRIFEPIDGTKAQQLFQGEHTRHKKITSSSSGALSKFVVTGLRCLACKGPMASKGDVAPSSGFCSHCFGTDREKEIIMERLADFRAKEEEFNACWTQCQRCQESFHHDIICTNRDCPIFYRRTKVKKDIVELSNSVISRLDIDAW